MEMISVARILFVSLGLAICASAEVPVELLPWLEAEQEWVRDVDGPIVSLGKEGAFDDMHIFAPMVAREDGVFRLWYCGARGEVKKRVFQLGLRTSGDGREFEAAQEGPVYGFGDGVRSVLTPTLLRGADGNAIREEGKLRMFFSATSFEDPSGLHTLHEAWSEDGVSWSEPSEVLLTGVYAPTVLKIGSLYQMWYTDVSGSPWIMRNAWSRDGTKWRATPEPCVVIDQEWEQKNLFYPTVIKVGDAYLMWYGSYSSDRSATTALGLAVSIDGLKWYKHPGNPVFEPDPERPWESNYTTSQSVMQLEDGSLRIWYASRKAPPFLNKYFAINTAVWKKPPVRKVEEAEIPKDLGAFTEWRDGKRAALREMLGIPAERVPLAAEKRGEVERDGIVIEKWVFTSEAGSRVPAVLYRPIEAEGKMPAIVFTFGHGGSKSQWQYNYTGQLYAKLGLACLALDPIGEEERHSKGLLGTRAHDPKAVSDRADAAGRLVMGKLVFDAMRGIDLLSERDDIDMDRVGVAGNSLGGAIAGWMAALEPRIKMAIVSGWAFDNIALRTKYCTRLPNQRMRAMMSWKEYASLAAPDCATLFMNGDADMVIDREDDGSAWESLRVLGRQVGEVYAGLGAEGKYEVWFEKDGGHRPYFSYRKALEWIHAQLGTPGRTLEEIRALPVVNSGEWCADNGVVLEKGYSSDLHQSGATLVDMGIRRTPREVLSALKKGELGSPEFTVEGWLERIEGERK